MRRIVVALAVAAGTGLVSQPAWASCFQTDPDPTVRLERALAEGPVVFVGTPLATGGNVRVTVEEIWRGPALPQEVLVRGSAAEGGAVTSLDRTYRRGTRYLFLPSNQTSPFEDTCTETREFTADLAKYAPADPRDPTATVGSFPWLPVGAGIGLAIALGAMVLVYRRGAAAPAA